MKLILLFPFLLLAAPLFGQQGQSSKLASLLAAAQREQAANNYAAAAASYQQAASLRPDIPELRANLGLMQHESGDYADAIRSFQQALRLKPSLYVPTLFLGIDYVHTDRTREAIPLLVKAEKMNPNDALPSLTLGRAWSTLGEYPLAVREFRHALRLNPQQGSAWFDLGIAQLDEVEEDARAMTSQYAETPYAKALFAESLVQQSRYKEADALYNSVLSAANQPPCMTAEAGFLALRGGNTQVAALHFKAERDEHPECGLALLGEVRLRIDSGDNAGALDAALAAWTRDHGFFAANALLLFSGDSSTHMQSFLDYAAQQHAAGTIGNDTYAALTRSTQATPTIDTETSKDEVAPLAPSLLLARQEYLAGHDARCAGLLKGDLRSSSAAILRLLAACSFFTGDYNLAYDAGQALLRLRGNSQPEALYWCIKANEKLAFESLAHFQQFEPNSAQSHILLGDIDRQSEHYDDAQREYAQALAISPHSTAALLGLAAAYFGEANMDKTIAIARKALQQSRDDPEINLLLGEALLAQHRFAEAEPCLQKALHAKQQMLPHVHALLGQVYAAKGETTDALRELKLGAGSDQDGSIHYQLARLYSKIGDRVDADVAIQQMRALQQQQRERAVIAVQDTPPPGSDDAP